MLNTIFWGYWYNWDNNPSLGFFGNKKCVFDGINKYIIVSDDVTSLDIRQDVYSDWKEWVLFVDNSKYLPAIRSTGGDNISGTSEYTGDIYFLINGWKLLYDPRKTSVTGVLYSDDYDTAYYLNPSLEPLYPAKVSSVVNTIGSDTSNSDIAQEVWQYPNRIINNNIPTVSEITNDLDNNSIKLAQIKAILDGMPQTPTDTANAIWNHSTAIQLYNNIDFIKNIEGGRWKIIDNQMIFYSDDNLTEIARFNLTDQSGNPTTQNVFERTRI